MFLKILQFELRYWLRQPMVYIFLLINALMVFGAVSSDYITIGGPIGNIHKNAPFVILNLYGLMSVIAILMATAFVQGSAIRDFQQNTSQLIFSTPLSKSAYLSGRFVSALIVAILPLLGVSLGVLVGAAMPWLDAERVGPIYWNAHLQALLMFAIPNTFFIAAIIFSIASLTRSTIASFVGALAVLVAYIIAGNIIDNLDDEKLGMLADPFGISTYSILTKYWTASDRNTLVMGWESYMAVNRLIWGGASLLVLAFTYWRFSFRMAGEGARRKKKGQVAEEEKLVFHQSLPAAGLSFGAGQNWRQLFSQTRVDFLGIVRSVPFIIITLFGIANMSGSLAYATDIYGLTAYPVTYNIIDTIRGGMYIFVIGMLTFFSGELVWKERTANVDQIYDALPHPNWVPAVSKLLAMLGILALLQVISMLVGITAQALFGYTKFELQVYFWEMLVLDLLSFFFLAVMSMFLHTLVNNKYIGYFAFVVFIIINAFLWDAAQVETLMVKFGETPSYTYSDMNRWGPFIPSLLWFNIYWVIFSVLLVLGFVFYWVRGKDAQLTLRHRNARLLFQGQPRMLTFSFLSLWLLSAGFVFYNTQMLNEYDTGKQVRNKQADYERTYKKYQGMAQPRLTRVRYEIDIFPKERDLNVRGEASLVNRSGKAIDSLIFNLPIGFETNIEIKGAKLVLNDEDLKIQFYRLARPLAPGDSLSLAFTVSYTSPGFENQVSNTQIVPNGSFFNNGDITPSLGYQPERELGDRNERRKQKLPERARMPELERPCTRCGDTYLSNNADWVDVETVVSTSPDQIAVAPGSLLREWEKDGRRYFHYRLDHPSMAFYSFISADFEVKRDKWKDVDVEVYYHRGHPYNVDKMVRSIKKSLEYYSEHFGPYRHKQARIIEFPRYASFAQAFPGTMPYSEGIGFIANIEEEDEDIDMVYYVVAHEMAHQWWAHQVIGAEMKGATLLSETMAQYSAIMVMEKEYGKDRIHKFLKYETDRYLRGRSGERIKELPLQRVESNQGYIHYQKGSAVTYYLKEMIGEDNFNAALRDLVDSFAYRQPPYPTSYELTDRLRARTPDSLQYLIADLFENITLFDNRLIEATASKQADGRYLVDLEIQCQKLRADSLGVETPAQLNDFIEIGLYAKPEKKDTRGKTLLLKRLRISEPRQRLQFTVDAEPFEAGVDPNYFLIDRIPEDNVKKVGKGGD